MPFNLELFCLQRLVYVNPSKHAGAENMIAVGIELAAWRQSQSFTALALAINNNHLLLRVCALGESPATKLVPWFERSSSRLVALDFNSDGQWLACVCKDGAVYLAPVYCLMTGRRPSLVLGSLTDLTIIQKPDRRDATCAVWWQTRDKREILITGSNSDPGLITFISLETKRELRSVCVPGCILSLELLGRTTAKSTFLLIKLKERHSLRMLIEASAEGINADLTLEVSYSKSRFVTCLDGEDMNTHFQPSQFRLLHMDVQLSSQRKKDRLFLAGHDMITQRFELMNADVNLQERALFTYKLVRRVIKLLFTDTIIFALCQGQESESKSTLNIISSHLAASVHVTNEPPREDPRLSDSVMQSFELPENEIVLYLYRQENALREKEHQTVLDSCLVVTNQAVYMCKQKVHPEKIFLELASDQNTIDLSDRLGIAIQLDVCGLYGIAAERQLERKNYDHALRLLLLAQCSSKRIAKILSKEGRIEDVVVYLQQVLSEQEPLVPFDPKFLSNLLLRCYVQQLLESPEGGEKHLMLMGKLSQFINDNFSYDDQSALEVLASHGLISLTLDVAKARAKVADALEILVRQGTLKFRGEQTMSLRESDHGLALARSYDGILVRCLPPEVLAHFILLQPDFVAPCFSRLFEILPELKQETLLRFARFFDPSKTYVRPLLSRTAFGKMSRCLSTSSLLSMSSLAISSSQTWNQPYQEDYLDFFLLVILTLKMKRKKEKLIDSSFLLTSIDRELAPLTTVQNLGETRRRAMTQSATVNVCPLACGSSHAAVVIDGDLYTWGESHNGRLGNGDIVAEGGRWSSPLRVEILHMMGTKVLAVSCGAEHTVALCTDGVYAWGSGQYGQLGLADTRTRTRPVLIPELSDKYCIAVACGQYHSMALTGDCRTWSWGWNVHGQLGLGHIEDVLIPTRVKSLDSYDVLKIAVGYSHTVVLTSTGRLLTFGSNYLGQLGLGEIRKTSTPCLVEALENVYLVSCGLVHTVAVTKDQRVYAWGRRMQPPPRYERTRLERKKRPAGYAPRVSYNVLLPQQIACELDSKIIQVTCGACHCLLISETGRTYAWGSNDCGQLGWETHSSIYAIQPKPAPIGGLGRRARHIACGDQFSVALDVEGRVWVWGREDEGQLGMELESFKDSSGCRIVFRPTFLKGLPSPRQKSDSEMENNQADGGDDILDSASIVTEPDWDHLPDFATLDPPQSVYDDKALKEALKSLRGSYRVKRIVKYLRAWGDWETLAYLYEQSGNWPQCLNYLLKTIGENDDVSLEKIYEAIDFCTRAVESQDVGSEEIESQAMELLEQMSLFWVAKSLEAASLEKILQEHLSVYGRPLCQIMFRSARESSGGLSQNFFSASFQLKVLAHIQSSDKPTPVKITRIPQSSEKLWTEILGNLSKDLDKRSQIVLHGLPSGKESDSLDMVCFTTGKAYEREYFDQIVLPQFRQQLKHLPRVSTSSAKMLTDHMQYSEHLASASPDVVLESLRYES
ncbi:uncharacterized protein [Oscarella lobularis]|uniref:uncharacterized protein isoform X2 n=1 Tax=Oscarella lobularis TaxID=121494 RepID=UPI0033142449